MVFGTPNKAKPIKGRPGAAELLARQRKLQNIDNSIEGSLKQVLDEGDYQDTAQGPGFDDPTKGDIDAPLVRLVNSLLSEAVRLNASDIHIEPFEGLLRVRFRIDGVLQEIQKIPHKLAPAITSRLKIMADLDICEKRIPQDGTIRFRVNNTDADLRISTLPSVFGEKIVMRVMGRTNVNNDLSKLGIPETQLSLIREAIVKPDGLVLVTGPTGSGKTTTLYAALNELNDISVSVFTAEDPVEGTLQGVTQCQANPQVGYTFASILRSLLRQDPDVILVGEIRDQETAEISIKAALTGHLVLSTLHTNCSVSTIFRLLNMGVAPYLIASSINCVVAQRLVRRICTDCKQERPAPPELIEKLGSAAEILSGTNLWHGKGCPKCNNAGFRGRAPIYEVLGLTDELRQLILAGSSREDMKALARQQGMISLREAGLHLVKEGITTIEEVLGVTNEDSDQKPAAGVTQSAVPQMMTAPQAITIPPQNREVSAQSFQVPAGAPMQSPVSTTFAASQTPAVTPVFTVPNAVASATEAVNALSEITNAGSASLGGDDKSRAVPNKWKLVKNARV